MIKPAVMIALLFTGALAFAVFQVEKQVRSLRGELRQLHRQMVQDQDSIHVLQAEWSYLNKPKRLKEMSGKYLDLQYVTASQVRDIDHIPFRSVVVSYAMDGQKSPQ